MHTKMKYHVPRHCAIQMAQLDDMPPENLQMHGRWNRDVMSSSYLFPMALSAIRTLARSYLSVVLLQDAVILRHVYPNLLRLFRGTY